MHNDYCGADNPGICREMKPYDGARLLHYLLASNFKGELLSEKDATILFSHKHTYRAVFVFVCMFIYGLLPEIKLYFYIIIIIRMYARMHARTPARTPAPTHTDTHRHDSHVQHTKRKDTADMLPLCCRSIRRMVQVSAERRQSTQISNPQLPTVIARPP